MKRVAGATLPILVALCVLRFSSARKSGNDPEKRLALMARKTGAPCSTHLCSSGYQPRADYDNRTVSGNATDANCCIPTCGLWNCSAGYKANAGYSPNVGAANEECCDRTCSLFTCRSGTGVPASKANQAGNSQDACCIPTCRYHACLGNWAQDLSKINFTSEKDEDCCQQSCLAVACDESAGMKHNPDRTDKAGTTTDYCCQKTCKSYASQCPADTAVKSDMKSKLVVSTSTSGALTECCDAKCSGHTCADGYVLLPVNTHKFVSDAVPGCCQPTCAAWSCSTGYVRVPAFDNHTQPSDLTCCEATCALFICPDGYFNTTDSTKLSRKVNRSGDTCCDKDCVGFTCATGTSLRPTPESIAQTGDLNAACCEGTVCAELREDRTPTGTAQDGSSTSGLDCNDYSDPAENCSSKYKLFNISGAITAVPCIMSNLSLCRMDDARVMSDCSDLA